MATFQKRGDAWRAIVRKEGQSKSASFDTKAEAIAWATATEAAILDGARVRPNGSVSKTTVADLFDRYSEEVSPTKRGGPWEQKRFTKLIRDFPVFQTPLNQFDATHVADWRDQRVTEVSAHSVCRELDLMSAAFTRGIKEWRLGLTINPMRLIQRPTKPPARKRRISQAEIDLITKQLKWDAESVPETVQQWVAFLFHLGIETAMRRGEMLRITWEHVHLDKSFIHLPMTKNGDERDVPLSSRAKLLLKILSRGAPDDQMIPIKPSSQEVLFRRAVKDVGIKGLRMHDSRREAASRFATKLDNVLELSAVTGHKSLQMLKIYYAPTPQSLADKMDKLD